MKSATTDHWWCALVIHAGMKEQNKRNQERHDELTEEADQASSSKSHHLVALGRFNRRVKEACNALATVGADGEEHKP